MALEDIERELYKPDDSELKKREVLHDPVAKTSPPPSRHSWPEKPEQDFNVGGIERLENKAGTIMRANNLKKKIIWAGVIVGLLTIGVLGYLLFQIFTYAGIELNVSHPDEVQIGVPYEVQVEYKNSSGSSLQDAKISLSLPSEFVFVDDEAEKRVQIKTVGTVGVGSIGQEIFRVMAVRGERSSRRIEAVLEYNPVTLGSRFEVKQPVNIFIGDPAVELDFDAPEKVLSSELFETRIRYRNSSATDMEDMVLRLEYPANYTLKTSSIKPDEGQNIWRVGDLRVGSSNEIVLQGSILATQGSFFELKAFVSSEINGTRYDIGEKVKTISVSSAPLAVDISVNGSTAYISHAGDALFYKITYSNNTDVGFRDVVLTARLVGEMFDYRSLDVQKYFNSITNTLTWNASNLPELKTVEPGEKGEVEFRIATLKDFPISRLNDINFLARLDAEIESPTVPPLVAAEKTKGIAKLETKIAGQTTVDAKGFFRDAASGIVNNGQVPPKVNQPTQYTLHWIVKNFSTDVQNVEIRAFLKSGVRATGNIKSNIPEKPIWNERTQEVVWNIPKIQATRGVLSAPIEAIFQIEAVPAITQVGRAMPLLGPTTLTAGDIFTSTTISFTDPEITSDLFGDDSTITTFDGPVVE